VSVTDDLNAMMAYLTDHERSFTDTDEQQNPGDDDEDRVGERVGGDLEMCFSAQGERYLRWSSFTGKYTMH
jgi:hypothetical protein